MVKDKGIRPDKRVYPELYDMLHVSFYDQLVSWITAWWWAVVIGLVVFVAVWSRFKSWSWMRAREVKRFVRWLPPRLRLAVAAADATCADKDVSTAFALRLRAAIAEQRNSAPNLRFAAVEGAQLNALPVADLPGKVQALVRLWQWLQKQNIVTLKATLLPADGDTVSCHLALTETSGAAVVGLRESGAHLPRAQGGGQGRRPPSGGLARTGAGGHIVGAFRHSGRAVRYKRSGRTRSAPRARRPTATSSRRSPVSTIPAGRSRTSGRR